MATAAPKQNPRTGSWEFIVDLGEDPATGKRRQVRRRGFTTKKAAQKALDDLRVSGREKTFVALSRTTTESYLTGWLETVRPTLRPATHHSYARNIRLHVTPHIGAVRLQALDGLVLDHLYAELADTLAPRTIRYIHTILGSAFDAAVKVGRLTRNPTEAATPPKPNTATSKPPMVTWTASEVGDFLTRCNGYGDRYAALWTLFATTGLRRGEALGLRWRHVDFDAGRSSIVQTVIDEGGRSTAFGTPKTASGVRTVDLDPTTLRALREQRRRQAEERLAVGIGWRDHDLVFAKPDGQLLDPERVSREFQRRIERWGLRRIRLHDLRHTWATLALKAGVHPRVVQERLGHSAIGITLGTYSHVTAGIQREAAEKVSGLIFGT